MKKFLIKLGRFAIFPAIILVLIELVPRVMGIPKISHHNIQAKGQNLIPKIDESSIVILGDSRLEWGLRPSAIKEQIGDDISVYNLAFPGSNGLDIMQYLINEQIYPKALIIGFSPYYGKYMNHGFDEVKFSLYNRIGENLDYFADQTFFLADESIQEYYENGYPYFKNHSYDKWGSATVFEYGDYKKRLAEQEKMYSTWQKEFNLDTFNIYYNELSNMVKHFTNHGTKIFGLYMPLSKGLLAFEQSHNVRGINGIPFTKAYDLTEYVNSLKGAQHDSLYYYDGSHLGHEYSYEFSSWFVKQMREELE